MPGVPSGKGCEACRKQKKKCDQAKPACSRCARLKLDCVGAGQQRYVFKPQAGQRGASDSPAPSTEARGTPTQLTQLTHLPSNETSHLLNVLIQKIKPSTDAKYNLFWSYGSFLNHIPKRIGTNNALDAGASVLISAHADFSARAGQCTPRTLALYSRALRSVRTSLADRNEARSSETLCAVYLLLLSQSFIPRDKNNFVSHGEGAAQILKARGYYNPGDEFERELLLSLRGPVVFEGILDDRIDFTPTEWKTIVQNQLDAGPSNDGKVVHFLMHIPHLLDRGRHMRQHHILDPSLSQDLELQYREILEIVTIQHGILTRFETNPSPLQSNLIGSMPLHFIYQRSYGISLFAAMIFNYMLRAIDADNESLYFQSSQFSQDCLTLAKKSHAYRPLGAAYVYLCLIAAWIGVTDQPTEEAILTELRQYQNDFPWEAKEVPSAAMERLSRRLRFETLPAEHPSRACL